MIWQIWRELEQIKIKRRIGEGKTMQRIFLQKMKMKMIRLDSDAYYNTCRGYVYDLYPHSHCLDYHYLLVSTLFFILNKSIVSLIEYPFIYFRTWILSLLHITMSILTMPWRPLQVNTQGCKTFLLLVFLQNLKLLMEMLTMI